MTVPGNIVSGGWPSGGPAWILDGRPLPYVDHSGPACDNPDAFIPAELVKGPILLISAGADEIWPSAAMAKAISERLDTRGHTSGHRVLEYPGAGHSLGYLVPQLPPGLLTEGVPDQPVTRGGPGPTRGPRQSTLFGCVRLPRGNRTSLSVTVPKVPTGSEQLTSEEKFVHTVYFQKGNVRPGCVLRARPRACRDPASVARPRIKLAVSLGSTVPSLPLVARRP